MFKEAAIPVKYLQGYLEQTYAKTIPFSYRRHCCSAGRQCLSSLMFTLLQSLKCSNGWQGHPRAAGHPWEQGQLLSLAAEPPALHSPCLPPTPSPARPGSALCYKHTETGWFPNVFMLLNSNAQPVLSFSFFIKKPCQLSFLRASYLNKTMQTLSFSFFYLLPIV